MLKSELYEIIANGENSGVEFKRDDCRPEQLAKEIVAMANLRGGMVLLGVEDDGTVSGIRREKLEEWIMDSVFGRKIHPIMLPHYEEIQFDENKKVAVVSFTQGIAKPYVLRHNNREDIFVRMGSVSRIATREQRAMLFATGGLVHLETLPVSGTTLASLDLERLDDYLRNVLSDPEIPSSNDDWTNRLQGMGFMAESDYGPPVCTIAGLVLFGNWPRRYLRQAGLRVMAFDGPEKDYKAVLDEVLDGPLVGLWKKSESGDRELASEGIIENFSRLIRPFVATESGELENDVRREKERAYPVEAIRETVINALAHRDWTRSVDIEICLYSDRMEIASPGALQNAMTIEKMIAGQRSPRNPLVVGVLRDYGYVDARGMGVRTKVIPSMRRENKADPIFEETEDYLKTTLPKRKKETQ